MQTAADRQLALARNAVDQAFQAVVDEKGAGARLVEYVGQFVFGQRVVDRNVNQAGTGTGKPENQVRIGILAVCRDPVRFAQAKG